MLPCLLETCFLKASLQYGKNVGVFPTYFCAIDCFGNKTENSLAFCRNSEICSLHCSMENTLLETKVDVQIRQCSALPSLLHIAVLRFRKKDPH